MANLTEKVINYAKENGADLVGIASADEFAQKDLNHRFSPYYYLPEAKTVIVIGLKLVDAIWDRLQGKHDPYSTNMHSYLMHYNYDMLDQVAVKVARYLEDQGYDGYPIEARTETKTNKIFIGMFPFKEAALLAGMGSEGKNTMLLTPEFGPRARLVAVITDAPLEPTAQGLVKTSTYEQCGSCTLCIDKCPVGALQVNPEEGATIDMAKCQAHMDWGQCALCQGVCVVGTKAAKMRRSRKNQ